MKIVTFNIRCSWDGDGINSFIHRAGMIFEKIQLEKPDIIGFQEVTDQILNFLESLMPEYLFLGHGRNADYKGEGVFTAILKETIQLISTDTFWLTETPYKYSLLSGQSNCPRTCVGSVLQEKKSGTLFAIYNTHLDHLSGDSADNVRLKELKVISRRIQEDQVTRQIPFFVLGDFNAEPHHTSIEYCDTGFQPPIEDLTEEFFPTFHGFHLGNDPFSKIDYIFISKEHRDSFLGAEIWDDEQDDVYLSDHYPIAIEMSFKL